MYIVVCCSGVNSLRFGLCRDETLAKSYPLHEYVFSILDTATLYNCTLRDRGSRGSEPVTASPLRLALALIYGRSLGMHPTPRLGS